MKNVPAKGVLYGPDETEKLMGIVISGHASVYSADKDRTVLLRTLGTGDVFGVSNLFSNEKFVSRIINELYRKGADVVYDKLEGLHASGHACQEELKIIHALVRPKFFIPVKTHDLKQLTCPVIGADSFEDNVFKKQFGSEENGRIFAVTNFNQHSEYQPYREFRDAYVAKYSMEPDYEAMQAYDAMMVLARSIHMAGSSQPEDIVTILKGELWKEAAGPYSFTQSGDIKNNVVYKKEFLDGEFVLVTKKDM